jgi:leucine dehydrogenase
MRIFDYAIANNISALEAANHLAERRISEFVKWNHKWIK